MRAQIPLIRVILASVLLAGVQEGSDYPHDAQAISDSIEEETGMEPMVSLDVTDDPAVLFLAMGGTWTGDDEDWTNLVVVCSASLSVDSEDWELDDIAVSFGDSWCRVRVEDIIHLSSLDIPEDTFIEELSRMVDVFPIGDGQ